MKLEIVQNRRVLVNSTRKNFELHPLWLRERVKTDSLVNKYNDQRLYDPSQLNQNLEIRNASVNNGHLNIEFTDGVRFKYKVNDLLYELDKKEPIEKVILWNSKLKKKPTAIYKKHIFETKEMYNLLQDFYKFGFVIFKKVPTEDNFILKFANSIGTVRPTNFGESFSVKSVPKPNDLAYTSLPLAPHTDNPYRNPVPCIQLLHCITNEVSGGFSTLVDGYTVTEDLKNEFKEYYDILTKVKVKFKFIDKDVILEGWSELIKLDENKEFKQVKFSPRLDFVPILEKKELDLYYKARNKISEMYNSDNYRIEFKLMPGDLLMMDNYRLLHGRTEFDTNEGSRFLQGAYIDFDSTEGKLRHLKRKFNF